MQDENLRVQQLEGGGGGWVVSARDGRLFEGDVLMALKRGLGKKMQELLNVQGITNLGSLRHALDNPVSTAEIAAIRGISNKKISSWREGLTHLHPGDPPPDIDHRKSVNPYISRYPNPVPDERGKLEWEVKVSNSVSCKAFVSIYDMIDHMFSESAKVFKGTTHEEDWAIYHDALSLFTATEAMQYMDRKGYLGHLILPQHGCNSGTVYANRMVGMRPEVMPLDSHLNQDLYESVDRHVNLTQHLHEKHEHKFSKRTPNHFRRAYLRIWDPTLGSEAGAPLSSRIREDIIRVVNSTYLDIFNRRGRVLDTAAYTGRRKQEHTDRVAKPWGGVRVRGQGPKRESIGCS